MGVDYFPAMYQMEDAHWWYVGMRGIFISLIDRHYQLCTSLMILDAGCGTGGNLGHLQRFGQVVGVDISSEAIGFCRQRDGEARRLVQSSLKSLPFHDEVFDLVTSFDVLCYVDDDMRAMHELSRILKPGGRLVVNLPAYGLLHSKHDVAVHVKKRYTRLQVAQMMGEAGLTVEKITYANTLLFPFQAAVRIARKWPASSASEAKSDLRALPPMLNGLLTMALQLERRLLQRVNLPFGLSVVSVGRKSG